MEKIKSSHRIIAVFLTLNFLCSIIPANYLYASNNGPNSPEAAGFEPVDATDMVNLATGDLSYVLPLMSVDGFPVNLSYHAGMTTDMDASWVGLGWYLNPGAINRSITNTPDDWKSGIGINFNSFEEEETYYGVTVEVGQPAAASVGVGLNWGGGQGISGSVSATIGIGAGTGGMVQGGVTASANTKGDASISAGVGVSLGSYGVGAGVSYSLKNQWSYGGFAGYKMGGGSFVGGTLSSDGGYSVGAGGSGTDKKGNSYSGGVGMSANSFSSGDASVDTQSMAVAIPLHVIGIPITLGFRQTKVKINIKKGFRNLEWGALYSSDFSNLEGGTPQINNVDNYNPLFNDYSVRTRSMDVYSTRIPQSEREFIGDYSKQIENINFSFLGYDNYNVAAQGIMGNMTPLMHKNATIFGKGQRTKSGSGDDIHVFWHHGDQVNAVDRELGRLSGSNQSYSSNDLYFYFKGQFTNHEFNDVNSILVANLGSATDLNDLISEGSQSGNSVLNGYNGRAKSPNYIEVFTNKQIADGHAQLRGLITPSTIPNTDRNDISKFDPNGIGAYKVTSPDGKTYHFALPVYHYEQIQRGQINNQESSTFNINNVNEKRQYSRYATHWLLTAITGSDYIDRPDPSNGQSLYTFNKEDYGYWVELEYGKWSDGYVWRTPYQDRTYQYNTNIKGNIEEKDKGGYSFGRKQLYYLDKINTKERTALFVKDIRYDAIGKNLKYKFLNSNNGGSNYIGDTGSGSWSNSLNKTESKVHVREPNVNYKREYSLKLSKIILVDSEQGKPLAKNNSGPQLGEFYTNYSRNDICQPGWISSDFQQIYGSNYNYQIHNEYQVLDKNDISADFINQHALKVVELNHDYQLAQNSPSSFDAPTSKNMNKGRLTLQSVQVKGKGGEEYMPATSFNYYMEDMPNVSLPILTGGTTPSKDEIKTFISEKANMVDAWGYLQDTNYSTDNEIKAWSLKDITMPTGAKIEIDYEEDEYWTEAFARRYWHNEFLSFKVLENQGEDFYTIEVNKYGDFELNEDFNFEDYFIRDDKVALDLWISRVDANYDPFPNCQRRRGHIDILPQNAVNAVVDYVSENILKINLPKDEANLFGSHPGKVLNKTFARCDHPDVCQNQKARGEIATGGGKDCNYDHNVIHYRLLANKVPEDQTGGGLRVKELRTVENNKIYKVNYVYKKYFNSSRGSGITSYAPVDGLKFVPYQSEIPAPRVMYEYVIMRETSNDGDYDAYTRYRHHVLKPVFDIFNPNISMEAIDTDAPGEDQIFWANVIENFGNLNGDNSKDVEAKKIEINLNTALIGQIKSVESMNSAGHVMLKTSNEYINGRNLVNEEPNKGYTKETFNSMKSIFRTNENGTNIYGVKRLLSVSSKSSFNNMLKKTTTYSGNLESSTEYFDVDPWLSSFRKNKTTLFDGTTLIQERIPAYEKYNAMQSKVLDHENKNMLTQQAMSTTMINNETNTLNASITTWNNNWTYRNHDGSEYDESGVWRKSKSFIWKEDIIPSTGAYLTNVSAQNDYFDWNNAVGLSDKWQNTSEIRRYTHWSSPLEVKDINGNFSSSKLADNMSKVLVGGNARYTEMYYTGAEHVSSGNIFEGEVRGAQFRTNEIAHTGEYSVKSLAANDKVFEIDGTVGLDHFDLSQPFRPGLYKISFWAYLKSGSHDTKLYFNGQAKADAETVTAGCWKQYNYYVNLSPSSSFNLYVTNTTGGNFYFDDFRMHPVYSSINSYVYDSVTDELLYMLDANNMGTAYAYDSAGRLKIAYKEVVDDDNFDGGFKITDQYRYHYKNLSTNENYNQDINQCLE